MIEAFGRRNPGRGIHTAEVVPSTLQGSEVRPDRGPQHPLHAADDAVFRSKASLRRTTVITDESNVAA